MEAWTVYLLECSDHTYYCGTCQAIRLTDRIQEHNRGIGSKYTRSRRPVRLLVNTRTLNKKKAYQIEYHTKKLSRIKKITYLSSI